MLIASMSLLTPACWLGSVYVYRYDASEVWTYQSKLVAHDASPSDYFGSSVAMYGRFGAIGSRSDDDVGYNTGMTLLVTSIVAGVTGACRLCVLVLPECERCVVI